LLGWWWQGNQAHYPDQTHYLDIEKWVINLDGGPATSSERIQFIKRMVELSQAITLPIRLVYYLPYHSNSKPLSRNLAQLKQRLISHLRKLQKL
jgi:hypothetical protein